MEEVTSQYAEADVQAWCIAQSLENTFVGGEIQPKKAVVQWLGKAAAKAARMQKPEIKLGE